MKHHHKQLSILIGLLILGILTLTSCKSATSIINTEPSESESHAGEKLDETSDVISDTQGETDTESAHALTPISESNNSQSITDEEINSLVFMREEEKLARDVYLTLYDLWELQIFQNIANSEQTHTDAVANLLEKFNIPDPADTSHVGVFVDADLQSLYDEFAEMGAQSLGDALKVGAAIEEIDILDLQEYLEIIEEQAIHQVYENLLKGSESHLRAFTSTLEKQTEEIYQPQFMTEDAYNEIVSGAVGRDGQSNGRRP